MRGRKHVNTGGRMSGRLTLAVLGAIAALGASAYAVLADTGTSGFAASTPSFALSASPSSRTVIQGSSTSYTVTLAPKNGFNKTVTLSASGLPTGAGHSFSKPSVRISKTICATPANCQSTLKVTTGTSTKVGTFTATIKGASGTLSAHKAVTLIVKRKVTQPKSLAITGDAPGQLLPGASPSPLNLTLKNPNSTAVSVTKLTVTIASVSPAACDSATNFTADANFAVTQYSGPSFSVPGNGTVVLSSKATTSQLPQVQMLDSGVNQDPCKGAVLTLSYTSASGS